MAEINLMDHYPRAIRPIEARGSGKLSGEGELGKRIWLTSTEIVMEQKLLQIARRFGREYFDGDRLYGYGGYYYNPAFWQGTAQRLIEHYQLKPGMRVLDVGCAKGFLLYDLMQSLPGLQVAGLDISEYALNQAKEEVKPFLTLGSAAALPYAEQEFDLVISINCVDHLKLALCKQALGEIQRVGRQAFVTVNAWRNEREKELLLKWNVTAETVQHVDDWKKTFQEAGYQWDYWWFLVEP